MLALRHRDEEELNEEPISYITPLPELPGADELEEHVKRKLWPWLLGAGVLLLLLAGLVGLLMLTTYTTMAPQCGDAAAPTDSSAAGLSAAGQAVVPAKLIPLYQGAAAKYSLGANGWIWLAAVNDEETAFGKNNTTSSAGAEGYMQFEPGTWTTEGVDGDGDGKADINNPADSIYSAAHYLHDEGAPGDWHTAILHYNHAEWYYQQVLAYEQKFEGGGTQAVSSAISAAAASAPAPSATSTAASSGAAGTGTTGGGLDAQAATSYAQGRGHVGWALADPSGQILASYKPDETFHSASITKAMLLVADARKHTGAYTAAQQHDLGLMIRNSDNDAANRVLADVGPGAVQDVAKAAGMTGFKLSTSDPGYHLGNSLVTAGDFARLFAQIDTLMPAAHRADGMHLLSTLTPGDGTWGILDAGLTGTVYSKSGWRGEGAGNSGPYTENQAAQFTGASGQLGLAVLTDGNKTEAYGRATQEGVAKALNPQAATGAAAGGGEAGGCGAPTDSSSDAGVPLTAGERAVILPNGMAAAPASAPLAVQQMIAAGNQIRGKPYSQAPPHGTPYTTILDHYDCSSSVAYLLFHAGFITDPNQNWVSGEMATSFGEAGVGHWVTLYANADHVYMYVAGLRWDTHLYDSADKGDTGIGWHTVVRDDNNHRFPRHPPGL